MTAGVRMFYKGFFTFGIDGTVINTNKDRVWISEAALSNYAGIRSPSLEWVIQNMYGGKIPTEMPKQKYTVASNQEQAVRDLQIDPALFTPKGATVGPGVATEHILSLYVYGILIKFLP